MILGRIIPREEQFYDLFERNAENIVEAGKTLVQALDNPEALEIQAAHLTEVEHWADEVTHQVMAALNRTFVTPLDREDIAGLAHALDDVVDYMEAALTRMLLFKLRTPSPLAQELAGIILQQAEAINQAVPRLRHKGAMQGIRECLVEINRLENEGDRIQRDAVASLFAGGIDPMVVIRWKDIFDCLESAVDATEKVAHVLEGIELERGR